MTASASEINENLKAMVRRVKIDATYTYRSDALADEKIGFLAEHCEKVLDIGKSSRERYKLFRPGQIITLDINQYEDYPDIIDDLCAPQHITPGSFDGLICLAVLEHVYEPISAVRNMYLALKPGGCCFAYVPFLYRYHGPADLTYQDYYRFTRDGIAYLFRDFSDVTLYPCRGRLSTMFNLMGFWKARVERLFGQRFNRGIDRIGSWLAPRQMPELQASGYHIWAVK